MENYADHFLIATPKMPDPRFAQTVIYICSHSPQEGAMGVVVNNYLPGISLANVMEGMDIPLPDMVMPKVFLGGPVDHDAGFFLHSGEYGTSEYSLAVTESIILSRDPRILYDIAENKGPVDYLFILGYSGWGPGQLENELTRDGWLMLPADYDDLFKVPPEDKWRKICKKYGINIALFEEVTGTA